MRVRQTFQRAVLVVIAAAISLYAIAPLVWALTSAFREEGDIFRYMSPFTWRTFIPAPFTLDNVVTVVNSSFPLALWNSILTTALTVGLGLLISIPAAFALAAMKFRGAGLVFAIILISFLIPFESIAIPLTQTFRSLDLQNTIIGIVLPGIGNGLAIFQLRQFFAGIPVELNEAARLDGVTWFGIMWRIYVPLAKPAIIGAILLLFVFQWQAYLWPLLIAPDPQYVLAPVAIANYASEHSVDYGAIFLAGVITAIVPLVVLLFSQKYFTHSITTTGSKG